MSTDHNAFFPARLCHQQVQFVGIRIDLARSLRHSETTASVATGPRRSAIERRGCPRNNFHIRPHGKANVAPYHARLGITLIEVVAGLMLAGTLLATCLVAGSRHGRQMDQSSRKHEAVAILDRFLAAWSIGDFDPGRLQQVANQLVLPVRGSLGDFLPNADPDAVFEFNAAATNGRADRSVDGFYVSILLRGRSGLGKSRKAKISMVQDLSDDSSMSHAWAEVLIR